MNLHPLEKLGFGLMGLGLVIVFWPLLEMLVLGMFEIPPYVLCSLAAIGAGAFALFRGQYLRLKR